MDRYRIEPGTTVDLSTHDPRDTSAFGDDKAAGKARTQELNVELERLQELMYAERRRKVLVVLQAMDTGGKDGTIRHVFDGVNPQGVTVASFKQPTPEELAHDYLWRIHRRTPGTGEITIFNRSHYEDVLVVRVHSLVDEGVWSKRYDQINAFEQQLGDEGTTILKFFLHISKDEQAERLRSRLDTPHKQWKFSSGDLAERARWADYMEAYEAVLSRTSTPQAPWYVVPADRKWYRNLVVSTVVTDTLRGFGMTYPKPEDDLSQIVID